jgi:hypothetical protein
MGKITFIKGQGGIPVSLPGKDHVSGFLMYSDVLPTADSGVTGFAANNRIIKVSSLAEVAALGIKPDATSADMKVLYLHLSEVFRINAGAEVYVGIYEVIDTANDYSEVQAMQQKAGGDMRQVAVFDPYVDLDAAQLTALQLIATTLEAEEMPLSILFAANVASLAALTDMSIGGRANVSVVIGEDAGTAVAALRTALAKSVSCIGTVLGTLSRASVHESIAWVQKFPAGIDVPGFVDGSRVSDTANSFMFGSDSLDQKRFIFLRTYTGISGSYLNDSHNLDLIASDYNYIERVRTIDKAIRGIRANLTPQLSGPVRVDAESGKLAPDAVAYLQVLANRALEEMEKAGELSGYKALIDPAQDILGTSTIEIVIKQVPVGVSRIFNIKIGYTTKIG